MKLTAIAQAIKNMLYCPTAQCKGKVTALPGGKSVWECIQCGKTFMREDGSKS